MIALLGTLIGTGILSTVNLYGRVASLTEDVRRTELVFSRHLDHSVDRDEWLRRDAQIQRAMDQMATKEDLKELRVMISDLFAERDSSKLRK